MAGQLPSQASAAVKFRDLKTYRRPRGSLCSTARAIGREDDALMKSEPFGSSSPRCHAATGALHAAERATAETKSRSRRFGPSQVRSPLGLHALMTDRVEIDHRSDLVQRKLRPTAAISSTETSARTPA